VAPHGPRYAVTESVCQAGMQGNYTWIVRRAATAFLLAAALPSAASADIGDWAKASVAPTRMSASSALTLQLHYEMTCGQPAGAITVRFPARMQLTQAFGVRLGRLTIPNVLVNGNTVTFSIPRRGMTCMSIAPATATFIFTGLRNPSKAGTYMVHAVAQNRDFAARVVVRA
jgi:hypothetical protein